LFQSLSFDKGSQQGLHRDTAYVVVDRPLELAACWIALEDIKSGSGELVYVPGSHRDPEFLFEGGRKHWVSTEDGPDPHDAWSRQIQACAAANPAGRETFVARKGDILIWHADLAHGGSQVTDESLSRQSLVGHFCPSSARPHYFNLNMNRETVKSYGRLNYSSIHYDLAVFDRIQ
jgi:phytanoyl-CoA hydroxylase